MNGGSWQLPLQPPRFYAASGAPVSRPGKRRFGIHCAMGKRLLTHFVGFSSEGVRPNEAVVEAVVTQA